MHNRLRKQNEEKKERNLYDSFWIDREFKAIKDNQGKKVAPKKPQPSLTLEEIIGVDIPEEVLTEKFSCNRFLSVTNDQELIIGLLTTELLESFVTSHISEGLGDNKSDLFQIYRHALSRFLVLSRTIGWDKKYRPFQSCEVAAFSQGPQSDIHASRQVLAKGILFPQKRSYS